MTDRSQSDARKRYYILSQDMNFNPSDFAFVNHDEALIDGRWAGRHEHMVPGYRAPICVGAPPLREKPKLVVGTEGDQLLDVYGFGPRYVSSRAKALLSDLDAEGFEFIECDTVDGNGGRVEPYWLMDAIRVVQEFDESRSSFIRFVDRNPEGSNPLNPSIVALNDIYWSEDLPDSYHAFYLSRYQADFILDEVIVDAWRNSGLIGALFTPLQPPTDKDLEEELSFVNYPYWTKQGQS